MFGYTSSPIFISNGTRLITPSISGAVLITPTPFAHSASLGNGPTIPFHSNRYGKGSPIFATPLGTGLDVLFCAVPVWAMTVPYVSVSQNTSSLPNLSSSLNNIGITMIPVSAFLNCSIRLASTSRSHGH